MKDMPLKKIRNFGGKLGAELQSLGCTTAGEVLALPATTLHQRFGERASWILYTVQGNSDEQVQVLSSPTCKSPPSLLLLLPFWEQVIWCKRGSDCTSRQAFLYSTTC